MATPRRTLTPGPPPALGPPASTSRSSGIPPSQSTPWSNPWLVSSLTQYEAPTAWPAFLIPQALPPALSSESGGKLVNVPVVPFGVVGTQRRSVKSTCPDELTSVASPTPRLVSTPSFQRNPYWGT